MSEVINYRWLDDNEYAKCVSAFGNYGVEVPEPLLSKIMGAFTNDDKLVGFLTIQLLPHFSPLYVNEHYRSKGIASALADKAIASLQGSGVEVYCFSKEQQVLDMMARRGFKNAGMFYSAKL